MLHFFSHLLSLRTTLPISQSDLAKALGVRRQTIADIELGKRVPTLYTAMKIAKYFGSTVESVFTFKEFKK